MKLLEPKTYVKQVGENYLDNCYVVEQEILLDDGGHMFAGIQVSEKFDQWYYVAAKSLTDPELKDNEFRAYKRKNNASKFWPEIDFDALNRRMEKLFDEYFESLDDTALHGGIRGGSKNTPQGMIHYVEGVVSNTKKDKTYYLQVVQNNDKKHYSITDNSIYMRIHLGPGYDDYFKNPKDITYFFDGDDLEKLGNMDFLKIFLEDLSSGLDEHIKEMTATTIN